ncbi:hypothetical protein HK102_012464, partial [Quaeritorhiza haematococci]
MTTAASFAFILGIIATITSTALAAPHYLKAPHYPPAPHYHKPFFYPHPYRPRPWTKPWPIAFPPKAPAGNICSIGYAQCNVHFNQAKQ